MLLKIKFETSALNDLKMTLKPTRSVLPHIFTTSIPQVPNFNPFHAMPSSVWVTERLKMTFNTVKVKGSPYMLY